MNKPMKTPLAAAILIAAASYAVPGVPAAVACEGHEEGMSAELAPISDITVAQLAKKLDDVKAKKATIAIFDANSEKTRKEKGIIPTAVLLSSSSDYDAKLLPENKDTEVVFYCASEKCGASHTAAEKAQKAGYTKVGVLKAGIKGWVDAGKPTQKPVG